MVRVLGLLREGETRLCMYDGVCTIMTMVYDLNVTFGSLG
jgi:hypothetical protein